MKQNNEAKKAENQLQDTEKEVSEEFQEIPDGSFRLVDEILLSMVSQPYEENDESYTLLNHICGKVVQKAVLGNINACELLFNRISGMPVAEIFAFSAEPEEEIETEFGIS